MQQNTVPSSVSIREALTSVTKYCPNFFSLAGDYQASVQYYTCCFSSVSTDAAYGNLFSNRICGGNAFDDSSMYCQTGSADDNLEKRCDLSVPLKISP